MDNWAARDVEDAPMSCSSSFLCSAAMVYYCAGVVKGLLVRIGSCDDGGALKIQRCDGMWRKRAPNVSAKSHRLPYQPSLSTSRLGDVGQLELQDTKTNSKSIFLKPGQGEM